MSGARARPAVVALEISEKTTSVYPPAYAVDLQGRSKRALGDAFGLSQYGVNLVTLAPGTWSSQRHWHENEDEFVYVIEGEIVLIDDAGEHVLTPGMCAGFKAGVPNGHHLINPSGEPASYLEVGTRASSENSHYCEADLKGERREGKWVFTRKDGSGF
jgi:uncharacterized cupin superfamily protein